MTRLLLRKSQRSAELSRLEVTENVNTAYDELAMAEASLSSAEDLISRAREISVQGSNSVLGPGIVQFGD